MIAPKPNFPNGVEARSARCLPPLRLGGFVMHFDRVRHCASLAPAKSGHEGTGLVESAFLPVEDKPAIPELLAHVLRTEGYRVDVAATLTAAISCLDERSCTLVVSDCRLPVAITCSSPIRRANSGPRRLYERLPISDARPEAERHEALIKLLRPSEVVAAVERRIRKVGVC